MKCICSMGLEYLPTFHHKFRWNVGLICHTWSIWEIQKQFRPALSNPEQGHIHFRISRNTGVCHRLRKWREALNPGTSSCLASLLKLTVSCTKYRGSAAPNDPHKKCIENDNLINLINLNEVSLNLKEGDWQKHNPVIKTNVDTFGPNKNMVAIEFTVFKQKIQHCYLQSWSLSILINFWVAFSDLALQLFSQGSNKVWP